MFAAALKKGNGIKYTPVRKTNTGGGGIFSENFLTPRRAAVQPLVFRRRRGYFRKLSPLKNACGKTDYSAAGSCTGSSADRPASSAARFPRNILSACRSEPLEMDRKVE